MSEFLRRLFSSDFMGHGYCYLWKPEIVWLHAISDGLIALSYYFIPLVLAYLVRKRRDLPFHWVFFMFGLFIFGCGTSHAMEIWTLWNGTYRLAGLIKAITAGASLATAIALVPIVPKALRLASPAQLRAVNLEMEKEIAERRRVEEVLQVALAEQKRIEERLRASEAQLMDAQRLARVGSFEVDIATDKIYWSDEIGRMFGTTDTGQSDFQTFLNFVHPKDRDKVLEGARAVRSTRALTESRGPVETQYRIIRQDGEIRFVRSIVEAIRNDRGVPVRLTGATQDITEQVKAEELLRQSEQRLQNAERLAQLGHWQWDLNSDQVIWSEECYRIFDQRRDIALTHATAHQVVVVEDRERVAQGTKQHLSEKKGGTIEFRIVRSDGELRIIRSVSEVVLDDEGEPIGMFGTFQDITDSRRAEEESVARQKLESVGTLASGIAHDFNNLLGGVLVQAELALGELAGGSNPEEELKAIREVALRGSEIVRELMVYAGKETAVVGHVDVSQIVMEMLQLLKVSVSKHSMLEADLGKDLPAVRANAAQLRQIVMNLVTNASDAIGDRDGVIRVATKRVRPRPGWMSGRLAASDYVQLEVSDTGCGISSEIQSRVFDPFFTTKSPGRGLGLAIVDRIARDLGGAIHVTSLTRSRRMDAASSLPPPES